jgi:hypothetical protein
MSSASPVVVATLLDRFVCSFCSISLHFLTPPAVSARSFHQTIAFVVSSLD